MLSIRLANVARPWGGGQIAGEPAGVPAIVIEREDLAIDLRPLRERDGRVKVSATYLIDNRGRARHLDLVFASGANELFGLRVRVDDTSVATASDPTKAIPPEWRAPELTPRPNGSGTLAYELDPKAGAAPVTFAIDLPTGRHHLAVEYSADAMVRHVGDPAVVRQFAYVLAPARTWDGFGRLALTVDVPPGWQAAVTPALTRSGDTLSGTFTELPADSVAIAVQAPLTAYHVARAFALALAVFVVAAGYRQIGRIARRRRLAKPRSVGHSAALGAAWSAAFFVTAVIALVAPSHLLGDAADHYGYGEAFVGLLIVFGAAIVFVAGTIRAFVAGR